MLPNPYQQYKATKVQTAGKVDLVVMLYQGAVRFIRLGIEAIERSDRVAAHESLVRAQDIIVELLGSLNREEGGQIASQLSGLYDYCFRRLIHANVKKDASATREVLRIMRELGTAWQQIAVQQRQGHASGAASGMVQPRMQAIAV